MSLQWEVWPDHTKIWTVPLRLAHRYRRLGARGVHHNKVCVAIARELAGFVWDIGRQVEVKV